MPDEPFESTCNDDALRLQVRMLTSWIPQWASVLPWLSFASGAFTQFVIFRRHILSLKSPGYFLHTLDTTCAVDIFDFINAGVSLDDLRAPTVLKNLRTMYRSTLLLTSSIVSSVLWLCREMLLASSFTCLPLARFSCFFLSVLLLHFLSYFIGYIRLIFSFIELSRSKDSQLLLVYLKSAEFDTWTEERHCPPCRPNS